MAQKEYLKMADYFAGETKPDEIVILCGMLDTVIYSCEDAAAHAINSHDELVAEVELLREHNKNMLDAINRVSKVIWGCQEDNDYFHDNVAMTRELFIEQYCCFPTPERNK